MCALLVVNGQGFSDLFGKLNIGYGAFGAPRLKTGDASGTPRISAAPAEALELVRSGIAAGPATPPCVFTKTASRVDLRLVCEQDHHFAGPVEPSPVLRVPVGQNAIAFRNAKGPSGRARARFSHDAWMSAGSSLAAWFA